MERGQASIGSFSLDVPPEPEQVRTARLFAAAVARHYLVDEDRVEDLKVAISEVATNSIKAHRTAASAEPIRIAASWEDGGLRFTVVDAGPGFSGDLPPLRDADPVTPVPGLFEGSLGLTLIRTLFPDVQITANSGRGTTVTFVVGLEENGSS